jgi:hypothetical protein
MKKIFLIALLLITVKTDFAQTLASYSLGLPSDKPFYYRDQNNIKNYPVGNILYVIDGNAIKSYPLGTTVFYKEGQFVKEFPSGHILYIIDGEKIKDPSGKILYHREENKIKRYSDGGILSEYENWQSPLWILICLINTGC